MSAIGWKIHADQGIAARSAEWWLLGNAQREFVRKNAYGNRHVRNGGRNFLGWVLVKEQFGVDASDRECAGNGDRRPAGARAIAGMQAHVQLAENLRRNRRGRLQPVAPTEIDDVADGLAILILELNGDERITSHARSISVAFR